MPTRIGAICLGAAEPWSGTDAIPVRIAWSQTRVGAPAACIETIPPRIGGVRIGIEAANFRTEAAKVGTEAAKVRIDDLRMRIADPRLGIDGVSGLYRRPLDAYRQPSDAFRRP